MYKNQCKLTSFFYKTAKRMFKALPGEYILLLRRFKSQERMGNVAKVFDHFKPRKVSINWQKWVTDFYTAEWNAESQNNWLVLLRYLIKMAY